MKIQCSCGTKYNFEVTPEMANRPIHFVCSSCGLDASEYVTNLIRQELATSTQTPGSSSSVSLAHPAPQVSAPASGLRIRRPAEASEAAQIGRASCRERV